MAEQDASPLAWLRAEASTLVGAGCVTAVATTDAANVLAAFGADRGRVVTDEAAIRSGEVPMVSVVEAGAGVIALELNGFQGSRGEVLRVASKPGKAASVFWNVNGLTNFACARKGKVLCSFELGGYGDDWPEGLPAVLRPLLRQLDDEMVDPVPVGAAMVEKYTGISLERTVVTALDRAYPMVPRLADLYPILGLEAGLFYPGYEWVVDLVHAAPAELNRSLAEWAAVEGLLPHRFDTDNRMTGMLSQLGRQQPVVLTAEFVGLLDQVQQEVTRARAADPSRYGARPEEPYLHTVYRRWSLKAFRHLAFEQPTAAAFGAIDCARQSLRADGQDAVLMADVVRRLRN